MTNPPGPGNWPPSDPNQPPPGGPPPPGDPQFQPPAPYGQGQPPGPGQPPPAGQPGYGPPAYGTPAYGQPPGPAGAYGAPPRKRRTWLWVLLGVFGLLTVLIGGCVALVLNFARPPIDAANEWIDLVDNAQYSQAHDALCSGLKAVQTEAETVAQLQAEFDAGISDYVVDSFNSENGNTTVGGTISVAGRPVLASFDMIEEGGEWKVCGYRFS